MALLSSVVIDGKMRGIINGSELGNVRPYDIITKDARRNDNVDDDMIIKSEIKQKR